MSKQTTSIIQCIVKLCRDSVAICYGHVAVGQSKAYLKQSQAVTTTTKNHNRYPLQITMKLKRYLTCNAVVVVTLLLKANLVAMTNDL